MSGDNSGTATALATVGTVMWCIVLIPQIVRNFIVKDTEGVPPLMMFFWSISGVFFAIYFMIEQVNVVLQVQQTLFTFFALISLGQCLFYPPVSMPLKKVILLVGSLTVVCAAVEVAAIVPLRPLYARGTHWPSLIFGIIAGVLLVFGLIPPYFELWKRKGRVVGINFIFLTLDCLGAIFSLASLAVSKEALDILGLVLYLIVLCMELGIFASHAVWAVRVKWFGLPIEPLEADNKSEQVSEEEDVESKAQGHVSTTPCPEP